MPIEKSAGAVIFRKEGNKIYYLLLHYPSISHRAKTDYWDFPKGHIEKGEEIEDTVKREIKEETGLTDINFVGGFKEGIKYFFRLKGKNIFKIVTFLLCVCRCPTSTLRRFFKRKLGDREIRNVSEFPLMFETRRPDDGKIGKG